MRKVGLLTGGGDCPGLNAVIRAVVRRAEAHSFEVMGIRDGWKGLLEPQDRTLRLNRQATSGILHVGGTILGTSRTNPFKKPDGPETVEKNLKHLGLEAVIAVGGEDTLGVAKKLHDRGVKVVGVPKTIDNDLSGTDFTFGFDTAVTIATEAIDRLHSTAESHHRIIVVEVMGRHAGWIATYSGLAGGADAILIPEIPVDIEEVCEHVRRRHKTGRYFSIVVVAEGAKLAEGQQRAAKLDEFGHERLGGISQVVAEEIEKRTGFETRVTVLGHIQRGGSPTAHDRVLATRFGVFAADLVAAGDFGKMAGLRGADIVAVPLAEAVVKLKTIDPKLYELAKGFFG
jgi:ATP-dependent phosphofructokinase / diphosphate-dependent phosphofructokinase